MISIADLIVGDVLMNGGSGNVYEVVSAPVLRAGSQVQDVWTAQLSGGVECSNPDEWELLARGPFNRHVDGNYSITWAISAGDKQLTRTVSAPTAPWCLEMMREVMARARR